MFEILGDGKEEVWFSGINIERDQLLEIPLGNDYFSLKSTTKVLNIRAEVSGDGLELKRLFVFSGRP